MRLRVCSLFAFCSLLVLSASAQFTGSDPVYTNSSVGIGFATSTTLTDKLVVNGSIGVLGGHIYLQSTNDNGGYFTIEGQSFSVPDPPGDPVIANALQLLAGSAQSVIGVVGAGGNLFLGAGSSNNLAPGGNVYIDAGRGRSAGDIIIQAYAGGGGKVGIAARTPLARLHVLGNSIFDGKMAIGDVNTISPLPQYLLHVRNDTTPSIGLTASTGNGVIIQVQTTTTNLLPFSNQGAKVIQTIASSGVNDLVLAAGGPNSIKMGTNGVEKLTIIGSGFVGVNKAIPTEQLHVVGNVKVEGKVAAKEVCVNTASTWCDYVFEPGYSLPKLGQIQAFIAQHKHLPEVPSEADVKANGYNLTSMDAILLKKLEEAYLYILDLEARMKVVEAKK